MKIGSKIAHYLIQEKLGEGGMGIVFKALDTKLERTVALKILRPETMSDPDAKARFIREAKAASALNHPNITTIYEIGEWHGRDYISMEYVEGQTLKQKIKPGPLAIDKVLAIATQTAIALKEAQEHDIVHRDIKSDNIMVTEKGQVKVMDFGLAKVIGTKSISRDGILFGTVSYMSPEQARGEKIDHRSDIWSFGVVLYEMITGQLPFKGDNEQIVIYLILNEPPEPINSILVDVPIELHQIIDKSLEKDTETRYQNAEEIIVDLHKFQGIETDFSKTYKRKLRSKKRKTGIYISTIVVFIAIALAAFIFWPKDKQMPRIAVAVFENRTGDDNYREVGEIAAEYITQGLQHTGLFAVYPVIHLKSNVEEKLDIERIKELGNQTGARIIISGRYFSQGSNMIFNSQIANARGEIIATLPPASCMIDSPFVAIDEMSQRTMGALTLKYYPENSYYFTTTKPPKYDALVAFNEGMNYKAGGMGIDGLPYFIKSSELDPEFRLAKFFIAWIYVNNGFLTKCDSVLEIISNHYTDISPFEQLFYNFLEARLKGNNEDVYINMLRMAQFNPDLQLGLAQAALITNRLHESIAAYKKFGSTVSCGLPLHRYGWLGDIRLAYHMLGQHQEELNTVNRIYQIFPSGENSIGFLQFKAIALCALGRIEEVEALIDHCYNLKFNRVYSPGSVSSTIALELRAHGYKEAAQKILDKAIAWYKSSTLPDRRFSLFRAYYQTEQWKQAKIYIDSLLAENHDDINLLVKYRGYLGCIYARLDNRAEAMKISEWLGNIEWEYVRESRRAIYYRARIAAILGDKDQAVRYLWDAYQNGLGYSVYLHRDMDLESLRGYPPFENFMKPIK